MRESVKTRLNTTADGRALVEAVEFAGGWGDFLRATGYEEAALTNFYKRGKFSQIAAQVISRIPMFARAGFTKERLMPSVHSHQWRPKLEPYWKAQAQECLKRRAKRNGVSVKKQQEVENGDA